MPAIVLLAALIVGSLEADSGSPAGAPAYSADSIVNSASGVAGWFAPNGFLSIYGQNLARVTRAIGPGDITAGGLPTALGTAGVRVVINQIPADLWYVSPTLVNVLVPTSLVPGPAVLQLESNGLAGPPIPITLGLAAPGFWQLDASTILAVHLNGSLVTASAPAHAGEIVVLFATALGPTMPAQIPNLIAQVAAQLLAKNDFQLLLNGSAVDPSLVLYAGVAPGTAGVYQINLLLPGDAPSNPEIRLGTPDRMSPAGRVLPLQ